jgi:HK97 gp10 family phage protein
VAKAEITVKSGINLDLNDVRFEIEARALAAINDTLTFAYDKARKYVPVRAIFQRTRRGPEFPRALAKPGASPSQVMTTYRRHPIATAASFSKFQKSLAPTRRINVPEAPRGKSYETNKWGIATHLTLGEQYEAESAATHIPDRGPTYGHNNSLQPVIRTKGETVTGDFRLHKAGRLMSVTEAYQIKGGKVGFRTANVEDLLTARGQSEVKSGRAAYKIPGEQEARIGGALRDSIRIQEPNPDARGGKIYGYVIAGNDRAYYARYQEFGTSHNRAHPFLRPALYESREHFKSAMHRHLAPNQFRAALRAR